MHTLYINGKFSAQRITGVQRVAAALVQALDELAPQSGLRIELLCPPQARPPALRHIQVRHVGWPGLPLHLWEQLVLPWQARQGRLLSLSGSAPWAARRAAAFLHDAALWDQAEAYRPLFRHWYRALFRHLVRGSTRLFTVSRFSQQRLAQALSVAPQRFVVVPNGSDHLAQIAPAEGVLERLGLAPGTRFLLVVGSDNPTKNLDMLWRAHARSGVDLPLVWVGGTQATVFRGAQTAPAGVLAVGALDDAALRSLYRQALALLCPSRYEGFGLPPFEAAREGCPALVAAAGAWPELGGRDWAQLDPDDESAWSLAIQALVRDEAFRRRLLQQGQAAAARLSWRDSAALLLGSLA